jgi:hypothetical protein
MSFNISQLPIGKEVLALDIGKYKLPPPQSDCDFVWRVLQLL